MRLPEDTVLLLHDLGKYQKRIHQLFVEDTVVRGVRTTVMTIHSHAALSRHFFGVSGSGKTPLSLDGLCQN
jgi:ATP-dependent phosphoenolpyruvate carboxykinase